MTTRSTLWASLIAVLVASSAGASNLFGPVITYPVGVEPVDVAIGDLDVAVAIAAFAIDRELAADLEVLFALRSHFDPGAAVTRENFASMAQSFLGRHPCLRALE